MAPWTTSTATGTVVRAARRSHTCKWVSRPGNQKGPDAHACNIWYSSEVSSGIEVQNTVLRGVKLPRVRDMRNCIKISFNASFRFSPMSHNCYTSSPLQILSSTNILLGVEQYLRWVYILWVIITVWFVWCNKNIHDGISCRNFYYYYRSLNHLWTVVKILPIFINRKMQSLTVTHSLHRS